MKTTGKILAGICATFFVLSSVIAIILFNIERKSFSAETYKQAFREQGVYESAPSVFADVIISSSEAPNGIASITSLLSRGNLTFVISSILPPSEMEQLLNAVFESFIAYLNSETDTISIPLTSLKQYAASGAAAQALTEIIRVQPECTADQLWQMGLNLLSPNPMLILCSPPDHLMNLVLPFFQTKLVAITSTLPDELIIAGDSQPGLLEFRTRLEKARTIMKLTPALPLFLLLGIVIFTVRSLDDWLRWWGIPFVLAGIISILFALIGAPVVRFFLQTVLMQGNADMPVIFLNMMSNVTGSIVGLILRPVAIQGIILTLIGVGMVGASYLSNKTQSPKLSL